MADLRVRWHLEVVDKASSRVLRQDRQIRTSLEQTAKAQSRLATAATNTGRASVRGGDAAARALRKEDAAAAALDRQIGRLNSAQSSAIATASRLASSASRTASSYRSQEGAARRLATAERARASAQQAGGRLATGAAAAGAGLSGGVQRAMAAAAGGGVLASDVATFAGFEQQMDRVQAVSGATGRQMAGMTKQAQDLGAKTSFSAREAADGMYQLSTAGFKANEVMRAIPGTLDLAAASGVDLADAASLQATTLRGFGLQADQAGRVADVLATTVNRSAVEMSDLSDTMKYIAPVARATGQSMEDMLAAVGLMGNVGVKGSQAGTTLRTALVRLTAPTEKSSNALADLGIKASELRGPKGLLPLPQILDKIVRGAQGVDKGTRNAALAAIFGREALSGMVALVDAGPPALERNIKALDRSAGTARRTARVMRDNVAGAWDNFTGSLETAAITLTTRFGPALKDSLTGAAGTVNNVARGIGDIFTGIERGAAGLPSTGPRSPREPTRPVRGARDDAQRERERQRAQTPRYVRAPRSAVVQRTLGQPRAPSLGGAADQAPEPSLTRRVGTVLGTAGAAVAGAGRQLLDALKPAAPFLKNVLLPLLEGFGKGLLSSVVGAFKVAVPIIKVAATVLGAIGRAAAPLSPLFRIVGTAIGFIAAGPLLKAISGLRAFGVIGKVVAGAARVLYAPLRLVGTVFGRIGGAVGSALGALGRFVGRAGATASRITGAVADAIGGLPGRMLGVANRAASGFVRGIGKAVSFARSAGSRIANGVLNFIVKLPDRLANIAGDVAAAVGSLGRKLVTAIVDGIKSSPGAIVDAVRSLIPGPLRGVLGKVGGALGSALGFAAGGVVQRQTGGLIPAAVSPGELVTYGGAGWTVPGARTAGDTVGALLPAGAAVWTDDGQRMLAAGVDPGTVLATQAPHFRDGGVVPGRYVSTAYGPPWGGIQGTGTTATGVNLRRNPHIYGIAVDPHRIRLGAQVYVKPNPFNRAGPFRAFDTGGAIKGNRIDFYDWRGRRSQNHWGRRTVRVSTSSLGGVAGGHHAAGDPPTGSGEDVTTHVPIVLGRSRTRAGLLSDAFAQGRTAGQAGLTRAEIDAAAHGIAGARANPLIDAIRQATTATVREVTIPGAGEPAGGGRGRRGRTSTYRGIHGLTPRMRTMAAFAARASARWPNYSYGGGHGSFSGPYDCSGFVSAILHAGKFLSRPMSTDGFKHWGAGGSGRDITIGVRGSTGRNAHMMMRLGSSYWEAGSHGVGRRPGWDGSFPIRRHPPGYRAGGLVASSAPASVRALIDRHGRAAFDPRSPFYVGEGLRRGGLVRFQGGGTAGAPGAGYTGGAPPRLPRAQPIRPGRTLETGVTRALSMAGGTLNALDALLGSAVENRIIALREELVARVRRGGSKRTIQRLQSVIDLIDGELGRRVGAIERDVEQRTARTERARGQYERDARRAGTDLESAAGLASTIARQGSLDEPAARANVRDRQRALERAQRAGAGTEAIDEMRTNLQSAQDELDEVLVSQIENRRALIRQAAQERLDTATFSSDLANAAQTALEVGQRFRGYGFGDTPQGMLERAAGIRGNTVPALQGLIAAQQGQAAAALQTGDVAGYRSAVLAVQSTTNDLASAIADAGDLVRDAAVRAAQDVQDEAAHGSTLASTGLARLELEQRIAGTYDAGGVQRSRYITATVVPALQAELAAIVDRERVYREQGMAAELRSAIEEEAAKRNEILQATLDATEQVADNTDPRKFGGTLGLGYGGSTITDDLIRAGLGV